MLTATNDTRKQSTPHSKHGTSGKTSKITKMNTELVYQVQSGGAVRIGSRAEVADAVTCQDWPLSPPVARRRGVPEALKPIYLG